MAAAAGAGATPPRRLKDLLELDCDSCSAAGFRCYPRRLLGDSSLSAAAHPMRHLLVLDSSSSLSLRGRRRPSKLSHLSRSISRRLSRGGGFWRRRNDEDDDKEEEPEAAGCDCDCEEETTSSSESSDNSSRRRSRASSGDSDFSSSASASASASEQSVHDAAAALAAAGDEHEEQEQEQEAMKRGSSEAAVDRDEQQLSPVAVMDFPADDDSGAEDRGSGAGAREDDDGAAWAPSFSLERLQRRSAHKIRRLGGRDDLGPVDLEARLAATSDPDADSLAIAAADATARQAIIKCRTEDEATPMCASGAGVRDAPGDDLHVLVPLLMGMVSAGVDADVTERLLLDFFFAEMKRRRRSDQPHTEAGRLVDGEAVATARGWLESTGTPRWGLEDVLGAGKDVLAEMERGRRWMQVGEEEREVGAVVVGTLVDQVVDELIWDLLV